MKAITKMMLIVVVFVGVPALGQVCVLHLQVPGYPTVARASQWRGVADLTITVGAQGQVVSVDGKGVLPILVEHAKENVKRWVFCEPRNRKAYVHLRYDYRLQGAPVYPSPPARVLIDTGAATVVITASPIRMEP